MSVYKKKRYGFNKFTKINLYSSIEEDSLAIEYANKKLYNVGKEYAIELKGKIEGDELAFVKPDGPECTLYKTFINADPITLKNYLMYDRKFTKKRLEEICKIFKMKSSAPKKEDLINRIAKNLPRIRTHGSIDPAERARYQKSCIEATVGVGLVRYKSIRAELIKILLKLLKLNVFKETNEVTIPLKLRFYADGGSSCSLPFIVNYVGLCYDNNIFKNDISFELKSQILHYEKWAMAIGPESNLMIDSIEKIKGFQLIHVLKRPFYFNGIFFFLYINIIILIIYYN